MSQVVTPTNLGPEFQLGSVVPNKITIAVDGTSVKRDATTGQLCAAPPVWDNTLKTITFPAEKGNAPQVIDLSQFTTDVFVNGGAWDAVNQILTLSDNDGGTADITVDLSSLLGVSTDAGNLLTDGTDGKPLLDPASLQTCTDAFGVNLFRSFAP